MEAAGFLDIQTPILFKPTPEGARDFVVPSRLHKGRFFALPQSPQILKQLTMIAGFDRYYQIAICFRDEDLRADRVQEITQLDVEMAFPEREVLFALMEEMFARDLARVPRHRDPDAVPADDVRRGRPAVRHATSPTAVRARDRGRDGGDARLGVRRLRRRRSRALPARAADASRAPSSRRSRRSRRSGARRGSRTSSATRGGEVRSPIAKFLSDERARGARSRRRARRCCSPPTRGTMTSRVLGALRLHLGRELGLIDDDAFTFLWVTDFPMFEWDEDERPLGRRAPSVHAADRRVGRRASPAIPANALAHAYDLIVNGNELGGGSFRIHEPDIQAKVFDLLALLAGGAAREVRVPARRARDGRAAAWGASRSGSTG